MPAGRVLLWVSSLGGLALLVRSLVVGPVSLGVAAVALVGYLVIALGGAMVPRLEMYGDVLCRGLPGSRGVALTFDDGPHPDTTAAVLDRLAERGARATFFVIGEKAAKHPDLVRRMVAEGHLVGLHGHRHDRLYAFKSPAAVEADIRRASDVVFDVTGHRPQWFRPPFGVVSPRTAAGARRAGVEIVGWTVRALDGVRGRSAERATGRVVEGLRPGAIVLLHDAAERDEYAPAGVAALPRILDEAQRGNLPLVTLDAIVGAEGASRT